MKIIIINLGLAILLSCSTSLETPIQKRKYLSLTSYEEMMNFINEAALKSSLIKYNYLGETSEGRKIPYLIISKDKFGTDHNKIKVMIFAAQHGDEQSGKEGALSILADISNGKLEYLFDKIDLLLIPNMNPDGTFRDQRRNANDVDLNRNHLILTENETCGLHRLFNRYLPEATLDVHEYFPYSKPWMEFGYIKYFDEQFGTLTNPAASKDIIEIQKKNFLPFIENYLNEHGFTFNEYVLDGPPNIERMRYSTVDINDGRQSFGIQNTFSLILEGRNGKETMDDIKRRIQGQKCALTGYLEFIYQNCGKIKSVVTQTRNELINSTSREIIPIRMEHVSGNTPVKLKLLSVASGTDTVITVDEFHTLVRPHLSTTKPLGYLIPRNDSKLTELLNKHKFIYSEYHPEIDNTVYQYEIKSIGKMVEEGVELIYPELELKRLNSINCADYIFVPVNQLASNLIVIGFEPGSMLGIIQYSEFNYLLDKKYYPILRVE